MATDTCGILVLWPGELSMISVIIDEPHERSSEFMKSQKDILNKIISADDLHWSDIENKFIALSSDDIQEIILMCLDNAIDDDKKITDVLNWCTEVKVGQILMKNFLNNNIAISDIDQDGQPLFVSNTSGNTE